MSKTSEAQQFEVFNAFEDLRAFAVPEDTWIAFQRGDTNLKWPSAIRGANDTLSIVPRVSFDLQKARLFTSFDEDGYTVMEFQTEIGKITGIQRFVGAITVGSIVRSQVHRIRFPRQYIQPTDYEFLARELYVGAAHFGYDRTAGN